MEYIYHKGYTHDFVTILPAVQIAYNTSQHSTKGKSSSRVEKRWNTVLPTDHFKKDLLYIHPTAKDFHDMLKIAHDTAGRYISEAKEYKKQRDQKNERVIFGTLHYHQIDRENAVEAILTEEFSRKHPVFPTYNTQDVVEVEDSPTFVKNIIKASKIRMNGKDQRQYLVIFKTQAADKDKWLEEHSIPDGNLHMRILRSSRRAEQYYQ
ncbi:hypothetical protein O181_038900 [Austropuccinia psidii MF-1]|uniref:Uncharacterized protein n=1 Tax=Austropuccinia psidii MF-1 TaxID=1389203 RepID=A0A9Q3DAL0_9BASI|nr:hypothetical protein [Austropuccinia psidii MF-1]